MKRFLSTALALSITVAALAYALRGADFVRLGRLLSGGNYWVVVPFLAALLLSFILNAVRWAVMLRPLGRFRWRTLMPSMMIGLAANNVFPARLGEFVRAVLFARQFRQPVNAALASLVLERMMDVGAILIYYGLAVLLLGRPSEPIWIATEIAGIALGAGCLVLALLVAWPGAALAGYDRATRWLPAALALRSRGILRHIITALSIVRSSGSMASLLLLSLLRWACVVGMVQLSLLAYGIHPPVGLALLVFVVSSLAGSLPGTPGSVGTLQAAFVFAQMPYGVDREIALASSALFLVGNWLPVTACGVLLFLLRGLHVADLRRELDGSRATIQES